MAVISTIVQVILAIPKILEGIRALLSFARNQQIDRMKRENAEAVKELENDDQRKVEEAFGSPTAGKPSGLPGTEFRDSLPDVLHHKERN
jgi:hypothetical protein